MTWLLELLLKTTTFFMAKVPWVVVKFFGYLVGILWFDIFRIRRKIAIENVKRVFPKIESKEAAQLARQSLIHLGITFFEYPRLYWFSEKEFAKFEFEGLEHVEQAARQNKGICLFSLHIGNPDLAAMAIYRKTKIPYSVITKEFKTQWLDDLWTKLRSHEGVQYFPPRGSTFNVLKALKKQRIVYFIIDQFMGPPIGVEVDFFGQKTGAPMGLAVLAGRNKTPVLPVYTFRKKNGRTGVKFFPEVPYETSNDKDQDIVRMTQLYTKKIEDMILERPEQWMWVHRRWKKFEVL